ncbi:hypothetical protein PFISCL1PPCAC_26920, partial [Pristionchus fissidentatus]
RTLSILLLLLAHSIDAEYTISVYRGVKNIAIDNVGIIAPGPLDVGADYSLEIKSTDLTYDYLLESCIVVETGEKIIGPPGCLKCTGVFINMVESAGYAFNPNAMQKSSIIHFRPNRPDMSFQCTLQLYPRGSMERACEKQIGAVVLAGVLGTEYLYWGTGLPWWLWLLIILLLLLLLCCCLGLAAFLFFRWKKSKNAVVATTEKKTVVAHTDVKPMCAVSGTQTSNFDHTSINRMALENGSEILMERATSKQSDIDCARVGAMGDEKVEVFSGHAGVYNVRNGTTHRYEKNPNITRTRHESELFEEVDRHSYFNQAYEPEASRRRTVDCVEGFDEVIRYTSDREIGEYDHVEREIETNHSTRFYNEPSSTRYYDRRHNSIPV